VVDIQIPRRTEDKPDAENSAENRGRTMESLGAAL
jgi:hypothetical protein